MQKATSASRIEAPNAKAATSRSSAPRPLVQDFWLWILLVGPVVAPLFVALGWPALRPFADGIYLLGLAVCPKYGEHLMAFGHHMAVCSSCWAAVWGLWMVRLTYGRAGEGWGTFSRLGLTPFWARWQASRATTRLGVLLLGFIPWALDVMLWDAGLWASPHAFMMLVGFLGGLSAGMLLLPAAAEMRARLALRDPA